MSSTSLLLLSAALTLTGCCSRHIRTAYDATPGNPAETQLEWRYGANDIRIQTTKLTRCLMDRWVYKSEKKPIIVLTQVDNRTDMYISTDMIRDILEGVAINDGRCTIIVGDCKDEREIQALLQKHGMQNRTTAPHYLAKVRLTKAKTATPNYDIEDYRMTMTLYHVETGECIDQAFDMLRKHVKP